MRINNGSEIEALPDFQPQLNVKAIDLKSHLPSQSVRPDLSGNGTAKHVSIPQSTINGQKYKPVSKKRTTNSVCEPEVPETQKHSQHELLADTTNRGSVGS